MAWHAYAVEHGLRVRRLGLRVGVTDIPLSPQFSFTNEQRRVSVFYVTSGTAPWAAGSSRSAATPRIRSRRG
jgi:hypothetical protein